MKEITVSGFIKWVDEREPSQPDGMYTIRYMNGQGWGIPTRNLSPEDFRALADHLERIRTENK